MGSLGRLKPRRAKWIREDVIPRGSLSLLAGGEGTGKTTFMLNLIVDLFRNELKTGNVHLCLAEDDIQTLTIPRLFAAGADRRDLNRIDHQPSKQPWRFPRDLDEFYNVLFDRKIKLAVLDPIDHLIDGISTYRARESLDELHAIAEELDMAIVMIGHLNTGGNFKSWTAGVGGARRLFGVCRSAFIWGPEPEMGATRPAIEVEPEGRCYVLTQAKNTNGPKFNGIEMPSALYERRFGPHPLKDQRALPFYVRIADVDYTPLDIINQPNDSKGATGKTASLGSKREQCKELIMTLLFYADEERGLSALDLQEGATRLFTLATYQDARKELVEEEKIEKWKEGRGEWRYRMIQLEVPDFPEES